MSGGHSWGVLIQNILGVIRSLSLRIQLDSAPSVKLKLGWLLHDHVGVHVLTISCVGLAALARIVVFAIQLDGNVPLCGYTHTGYFVRRVSRPRWHYSTECRAFAQWRWVTLATSLLVISRAVPIALN